MPPNDCRQHDAALMACSAAAADNGDTERLLAEAGETLREAGVVSARIDAEWLLSFVTGVPRGSIWRARPDTEQRADYARVISERARRVPLQHLTGVAAFRYLELSVGPGVFIPRPETEAVAGWAIDKAADLTEPVVVDLGTGSGAIACAVASEVPSARVYAVELDEQALRWAERNTAGTGIELRNGDLAAAFHDLNGCVDIVVANPPYIPFEAWESVQVEVRDHDPLLALWSGADGLDALRVVERTARRLLRAGGAIAVEHGDVQGEPAAAIFTDAGLWNTVRDREDLAGKPRFVTAFRESGPAPIV